MELHSLLPQTHLVLHRRPPAAIDGGYLLVEGHEVQTVAVPPEAQAEPFAIDFETATERLAALPRLFIEPDGSFVWVSAGEAESSWQLDGVVNDRAARVVAVELKGTCPRAQFEQLLRIFDWPETGLLIQHVHAAVFLEVGEFLRFAERPGAR